MPLLEGQRLVDAAGNLLLDASAQGIKEAGIQVQVLSGGILMAAGGAGLGELLDKIIGLVGDVAAVADNLTGLVSGSLTMQAVRVLQDDVNSFLENGGADLFTGHDPLHHPSLLTAEGIINSIGTPSITWPTDAPSWYTAPSGASAGEVWGYVRDFAQPGGFNVSERMDNILIAAGQAGSFQSMISGHPLPGRDYFRFAGSPYTIFGLIEDSRLNAPQLSLPVRIDFSLVEEGDTVLSFLLRTQPSFDWAVLGGPHYMDGGPVGFEGDSGGNQCWIFCTLTDADLHVARSASMIEGTGFLPTGGGGGAPVSPGADHLTLGTTQALGASGTITETMDGIFVEIDHCDTDHRPAYSYDGAKSWRNIGALAFVDDLGHIEMWQAFNFDSAIYTPRSMAHASAVKWFTTHGPVGTVQAWTVSA